MLLSLYKYTQDSIMIIVKIYIVFISFIAIYKYVLLFFIFSILVFHIFIFQFWFFTFSFFNFGFLHFHFSILVFHIFIFQFWFFTFSFFNFGFSHFHFSIFVFHIFIFQFWFFTFSFFNFGFSHFHFSILVFHIFIFQFWFFTFSYNIYNPGVYIYMSQNQYTNNCEDINNIILNEQGSLHNRFMNVNNQLEVIKIIYRSHQNNGGKQPYSYFRSIIPTKMKSWIPQFLIKYINLSYADIEYAGDLYFINKQFIKDHHSLYKTRNVQIDSNVYKLDTSLFTYDEDTGNLIEEVKQLKDLTAADYGLIDVWEKQTTEVSARNMRYGNAIPVWQRSMNIRHYDRANEGFDKAARYSSMDNIVLGYNG